MALRAPKFRLREGQPFILPGGGIAAARGAAAAGASRGIFGRLSGGVKGVAGRFGRLARGGAKAAGSGALGAAGFIAADTILGPDGQPIVVEPDQPPASTAGVVGEALESIASNPLLAGAVVVLIGAAAKELGSIMRQTDAQGKRVYGQAGDGLVKAGDDLLAVGPILSGALATAEVVKAFRGTSPPPT